MKIITLLKNLEMWLWTRRFYVVAILVALLPWQARLTWPRFNANLFWEYGTISLYVVEVVVWVLVLWWILKNVKKINCASVSAWLKKLVPLLPLTLWLGLSFIWTQDVVASLSWLTFAATAVAFGFLYLALPDEKKFWALLIANLLACSSIFVSWFWQFVPASPWLGTGEHHPAFLGQAVVQFGDWSAMAPGERWLRAYGLFPHPNIAAGFVVLTLLSLWLLADKNGERKYVFVSATTWASAISGAAVIATMSKAGVLALITMLILWLIIYRDSYYKFAIALVMGLAIFCALAWPQVWARLEGSQTFEQISNYERTTGYRQAWEQKNWQGFGLRASTLSAEKKLVMPPQPVHSVPLLWLREAGLVGLALALGTLLFYLIKNGWWQRRAFWLSFIGSAPLWLFDHYWLSLFLGFLMIVILVNSAILDTKNKNVLE